MSDCEHDTTRVCSKCGETLPWYFIMGDERVYVTNKAKKLHEEIFGKHGYFFPTEREDGQVS